MTRTIQEIAELLDVEHARADGLVKYLLERKQARFRGERPNPSGKGKGKKVYEVLPGAAKVIARDVAKLEE